MWFRRSTSINEVEFVPFTYPTMSTHQRIHPSLRSVLPHVGIAECFTSHETQAQADCMRSTGHHMQPLGRFGHGRCMHCAADCWSASFVISGCMPIVMDPACPTHVVSDTGMYIADTLHRYRCATGTTR